MVPLLTGEETEPKTGAFSQAARSLDTSATFSDYYRNKAKQYGNLTHMGYSIRTESWRYTEWVEMSWNQRFQEPMWSKVMGRELYDHRDNLPYPKVFDAYENQNLEATHADICETLSLQLRTHFRRDT